MIAEIAFCLIHPNIGFHCKLLYNLDINYTTIISAYLLEITYNINDFIIILLFLRSYTFYRFFICLSKYYGARANRVMY